MSDLVEVTHQSWGSRLAGSIRGVVTGLAMFAAAFPLLFWNEGRAVKTARSLEEGAGAVVSVAADRVDAANDGRLVHTTGTAVVAGPLRDTELGVEAPAVRLERKVEMYQWRETSRSETKKKLGGGTETVTTTSYEKDWSSSVVDDSRFKQPAGHANPDSMPVGSREIVADDVRLGAFTLSEAQVAQLSRTEPLRLDAPTRAASDRFGTRIRAVDGNLYLGRDPASPEVGDVRISYAVVKPGPVSVVGRQIGSTFEAYRTKAGGDVLMVREGTVSAAAMFQAAQDASATMTWILRVVGFFVMFLGLTFVLRPLSVLGDVVPFVGNLVGTGVTLLSGGVAAFFSLGTIAVAWVFYRPLLGVSLIVLAVGTVVAGFVLARSRRAAPPAVSATAA